MQSGFLNQDQDLTILQRLEISQMHLSYHEVQPSQQLIQDALEAANLSINLTGRLSQYDASQYLTNALLKSYYLTGALGKRTRFQQQELAQLTLDVQSSKQAAIMPSCSQKDLPKV